MENTFREDFLNLVKGFRKNTKSKYVKTYPKVYRVINQLEGSKEDAIDIFKGYIRHLTYERGVRAIALDRIHVDPFPREFCNKHLDFLNQNGIFFNQKLPTGRNRGIYVIITSDLSSVQEIKNLENSTILCYGISTKLTIKDCEMCNIGFAEVFYNPELIVTGDGNSTITAFGKIGLNIEGDLTNVFCEIGFGNKKTSSFYGTSQVMLTDTCQGINHTIGDEAFVVTKQCSSHIRLSDKAMQLILSDDLKKFRTWAYDNSTILIKDTVNLTPAIEERLLCFNEAKIEKLTKEKYPAVWEILYND
jgi:hypothetical protein